ncbi:unnamed protein product [Lymnaea stagnalis]|uniref:Uncharacterized protein n=1 Tax=Lymnaea stagnalis TaxID=6523 RepID=A0AAV2HL63_LYMST
MCKNIACDDNCECKCIVQPCPKRIDVCQTDIAGCECRKIKQNLPVDDPWENPLNPYNDTKTGYLGQHRSSMMKNPLLFKSRLGIHKRCSREMPCDDYTFGSLPKITWTASHALAGWSGCLPEHKTWVLRKRPTRCSTNFLALNRAAITAGITQEQELRDFRNTHSRRFSKKDKEFCTRGKAMPISLDSSSIFGAPTRYTNTVADLITNQEHKDWLNCVRPCMESRPKCGKPDPWKENHAYTLRMFKNDPGLKPGKLWHMPKFENIAQPHLSTFRKDAARLAAFNARNYDKVGRDGMFGQGIPTKAINERDTISCFKA